MSMGTGYDGMDGIYDGMDGIYDGMDGFIGFGDYLFLSVAGWVLLGSVVVFLLDRLDIVLGSVRQWRIIIQYILILCLYKLKLKLQDRSSYHN